MDPRAEVAMDAPETPREWTEEQMAKAIADSDIQPGDIVFCLQCLEYEPVLKISCERYRSSEDVKPELYYDHWDSESHGHNGRCGIARKELITEQEIGTPMWNIISRMHSGLDHLEDRLERTEKELKLRK